MTLKVYGCRASIAAALLANGHYGSNTSCFLLDSNGQKLIFDAGSGIAQLQVDYMDAPFKPDILISHLHLDHTIGLTVYDPIWNPSGGARIFTCLRGPKPLKEQVFGAFAPPYWPLDMTKAAKAECLPCFPDRTFTLGELKITPFIAQHPDSTVSYHVTNGDKTIVYLLDTEVPSMNQEEYNTLVKYTKNADLVVFDTSYTPDDYPSRSGWGHSSVQDAVELQRNSDCKQMLLAHFDPFYPDEVLDTLRHYPGAEKFLLAREGMVVTL